MGRRGAARECRRLAGSTPRGADRNPTRRDSRGAGRSSSGASSQPPVAALFETLTSAVHRHRRPAVLCTSRTDPDLVRGVVAVAVLTRVVDETQSPAAASAPTLPARRRFSHDSLRRRVVALADVTAVIVAAGAFWASGAPAEDAAAVVLFAPGWLLVAKACGLYDRDHRSIRCLTIDELGRIVGLALAGTAALATVILILDVNELTASARAPALDPRRGQRLHVPRCRARDLAVGDSARAHADPRRRCARGRDTEEARALPGHPRRGGRLARELAPRSSSVTTSPSTGSIASSSHRRRSTSVCSPR